MKRFLLVLLVFQFFTFAANAQIQKGSVLLGGKINYTRTYSDLNITSGNLSSSGIISDAFSFNPQIGYTLKNNWVIGSILSFQLTKAVLNGDNSNNNFADLTEYAVNGFGVSLFARKYLPFGDKFSAFGELSSGGLWNNITEKFESGFGTATENRDHSTVLQTNLMAGLAYFPKNWLAIELSTNILTFTSSDQDSETSNSSSDTLDFGFNSSAINLGVSFFLNNK